MSKQGAGCVLGDLLLLVSAAAVPVSARASQSSLGAASATTLCNCCTFKMKLVTVVGVMQGMAEWFGVLWVAAWQPCSTECTMWKVPLRGAADSPYVCGMPMVH